MWSVLAILLCVKGTQRKAEHKLCEQSRGTEEQTIRKQMSLDGNKLETAEDKVGWTSETEGPTCWCVARVLKNIHTLFLQFYFSVERSLKTIIVPPACLTSIVFVYSKVAFALSRLQAVKVKSLVVGGRNLWQSVCVRRGSFVICCCLSSCVWSLMLRF